MSDSGKAVFLSYASQDAEAAKRIADALRSAGVEVWFDQSELRGGDAWDAMIRKRIKECSLFVPIITPNTNARAEGYFRLEWKLAVDRSHLMADDAPFLFPIVVGDITDATARVPDKFRDVQWTRLRLDETPGELAARVARLLSGNVGSPLAATSAARSSQATTLQRSRWQWWMIFPIIGTLMGLIFAVMPMWRAFQGPAPKRPSQIQDAKPQTPILSEARQLVGKARALIEAIDSTADDFAAAESLIKRALELDATDGEVWAVSSRINSSFLSRGFERSAHRRETARSQAERAVKLAPDLPEAWLALGRAIGMTDAVRAEEALRRGLTLAPENGRLQLGLASIYRQSNRFDEALALYERAATQPEHRALALYDQYLIHFYCRRFAEADRCLRESISVSKSANMVAGLALLNVTWRGDIAQAQRVLADTSASLRGQTRVVLAGVLVNLMAGQPDEALLAFDRLPADYVNDAWYTGPKALLVGLAHFQAGRQEAARIAWESGLAVVRRRLQEAPNDLELHLRLGELLAWTGQAEPALQEARIFNELQRGRSTDWTYSSVRIHAALGRVDDALPLLEQLLAAPSSNRWPLTPALLRIDPLWSKLRGDPRFEKLCEGPKPVLAAATLSPARALVAKATPLHENLDAATRADFELAGEMFKQALELAPLDAEVWAYYSWYCNNVYGMGVDRTKEREAEIKRAADRAMKLDPKSEMARFAWANYYRRQPASVDEAIQILRELTQGNPEHKRAMLRVLAGAVARKGNLEEALAILDQAISLPGGDAHAWVVKGDLYGLMNRRADSEAAYDRSLATKPTPRVLTRKALILMQEHGDLAGAENLLLQLSGEFLQEDRAVAVASRLALWQRKPALCLEVLARSPREYLEEGNQGWLSGPKALQAGYAYWLQDKPDLARLEWEESLRIVEQRLQSRRADLSLNRQKAELLALLGRRSEAEAAVRLLEQRDADSGFNERLRIIIDIWNGGIDARAEKLLAMERNPGLIRSLRYEPQWEPLRKDPRFQAILSKGPKP